MRVEYRQASATVRSVVRSFAERRGVPGQQIVTAPLPARPDQFIEIYIADRYGVSRQDGPWSPAPEIVVIGPQSRPGTRLTLSGDVHTFTIRFQPAGFHTLFGLAMTELVDQGVAAGDVIAAAATPLRDAVLNARDFGERVVAAEHWIGTCMVDARPSDVVAQLAERQLRSHGRLRIAALARLASLSHRQFTRRFAAQVGLPPKLYARTIRLNAVLAAKAASPQAAWTDLAHDAGYADQAHFIRDCHALAGETPTDFIAQWSDHGR